MPNPHLSILVVDDAKFSSAMIGRALSQAGYQDVRFASSASEASRLVVELRQAGHQAIGKVAADSEVERAEIAHQRRGKEDQPP